MERDLKVLIEKAKHWPDDAQAELEAAVQRIEARLSPERRAAERRSLRAVMLAAPSGDWSFERVALKSRVRPVKL